eukprot:5196946-Amphidinium_carterae.1
MSPGYHMLTGCQLASSRPSRFQREVFDLRGMSSKCCQGHKPTLKLRCLELKIALKVAATWPKG